MPDEEPKNNQQAPQEQPQEQPSGPVQIQVDPKKQDQARKFFDRAGKIASSGNHDYAMQMYLEGLRINPDDLQTHQALLEQALRRQAAGGKKASLVTTLKLKLFGKAAKSPLAGQAGSKEPIEELLHVEGVWAKDPQNLSLADIVVQKMLRAGCLQSAKWLAAWLGDFNARAAKPDGQRFSMLADVFSQIGELDKAVDACRAAATVLPNDSLLQTKLKNMLATQAMRKGKYDEQGGFRQSLQDREAQEEIQVKESVTRSQSLADKQIDRARKELQKNPDEPGKVMPLVDALLTKDDDQADEQAIEVLKQAHQKYGSYRYQQRASETRIRANRRRARAMRAKVDADADNEQLVKAYKKMLKENLEVELAHFQESAKNYPTDMRLRFELGRRFLQLGRYDEAIPALQEGQRDPKNHLRAMSYLGQCFFKKKWYSDAIDVYTRSLEMPDAQIGTIGKELQYNLGRAYEANGQAKEAKKAYSSVAQTDFLYKDVRHRLEKLRGKSEEESNSQ